MNHEKRVQLAAELANLVSKKYASEILLGGLYGSTARGTDTQHSDLEMLFVVRTSCKAQSFSFAYHGMPVNVLIQKTVEVEKDIREIKLDWPLKMGRLFNLRIICGDVEVSKRFKQILNSIPKKSFDEFIGRHTPLCYEGLGRLKAVKIRGNVHEIGLFVAEVLMEFMLLTAIFQP